MTIGLNPKSRALDLSLGVLFAGGLIVFLVHIGVSFYRMRVPEVGGFGNAASPYSDALDPWLKGALGYYLHDTPTPWLYRPTVGLFFSSLLTLFQSVRAIPITFIAVFLVSLAWLFAGSPTRLRIILAAAIVMLTLSYNDGIALLNPECVMVDFWAMSFSVLGLFLVALSHRPVPWSWLPAVAGFLLVGVVAAVRGPQLLGGGLVLLWSAVSWLKERKWISVTLSVLAFLAPTLVDSAIGSKYHVVNNSFVQLYCVYTSPDHAWTPQADLRYHRENPTNQEVFGRYLKFILSDEAAPFRRWAMRFAPSHDAAQIARPIFAGILLFSAMLGWLVNQRTARSPEASGSARWRDWMFKVCLAGSLTAGWMTFRGAQISPHPLLLLAGFIAAGGIVRRRPIAASFALGYIGSVVLHAMIGLPGSYRVAMTYETYIFVAVIGFIVERSEPPAIEMRGCRGVALMSSAVLVAICLAYAGNFLALRGQKRALRAELAKPNRVMKVSSDRALDRSLYFDGQLVYFYTNYDSLPFGKTRTYLSMKSPGGLYHGSFIKPCVVTWEAERP
jgi:hypothetical protein